MHRVQLIGNISAVVRNVCVWPVCRTSSVIVDLSVDFSTSLNDTLITNDILPKILQNLMALNDTIEINGVKHSAAVDMIFEREVPRMNGSLISADNVTACMSVDSACSLVDDIKSEDLTRDLWPDSVTRCSLWPSDLTRQLVITETENQT